MLTQCSDEAPEDSASTRTDPVQKACWMGTHVSNSDWGRACLMSVAADFLLIPG